MTGYGEVVTTDFIPGSEILPDVPEASAYPDIGISFLISNYYLTNYLVLVINSR